MNVADDPASVMFTIGAEAGEDRVDLTFDIDLDAGWASVDPANGRLDAGTEVEVELTVNPAGLEPDTEYNATMMIVSNDPENREIAVDITLTTDPDLRTITLDLAENWNMISINVDPAQFYADDEERGPDVIEMFDGLRNDEGDHRIALLKNEDGLFYAPAWGFNNIPFWNLPEGYQVNMTEAIEYDIEGTPIDADADVPLEPLWNLVAYFPTYDLDASAPDFYVLSPVIENVFLAKDGNGLFLSPQFRFSNMDPWTQGQGYQIKVTGEEEIVLNYPPAQEEAAFAQTGTNNEGHWIAPVSTGENMSVLVSSVSGVELGEGDQIAAYSASGLLIGTGNIIDGRAGLAVWGDDLSTKAIEGAVDRELFNLKLWDADHQIVIDLEASLVHNGTGLVYETNAFTVLDVNVTVAIPDDYYLSQNYPNPFNSTTRIDFGMPETGEVSVRLYDVAGRLVTELVSSTVNAGNHTLVWDASTAPAGIYMVQMSTEAGFKSIRKIMLVK